MMTMIRNQRYLKLGLIFLMGMKMLRLVKQFLLACIPRECVMLKRWQLGASRVLICIKLAT